MSTDAENMDPLLQQLTVSPEDLYTYGDIDIEDAVDLEAGPTLESALVPAPAASADSPAGGMAAGGYGTPEFEARRRAAMLDAPDTMVGIRNVRNMVGEAAGLTPEQSAKYRLSELEAMAKNGGAGGFSSQPEGSVATGTALAAGNQMADALSGRGALRGGGSAALALQSQAMEDKNAVAQNAAFSPSGPERLDQDMAMATALAGSNKQTLAEKANGFLQNAFRGKADLSQPADYSAQPIELRTGEGELERRFASLAAAGFPVSAAQLPGAYLGTQVIGMPNQVASNTRADLGFLSPEELERYTVTSSARYPRF